MRLRRRCLHVNFAKYLGTIFFLQNTFGSCCFRVITENGTHVCGTNVLIHEYNIYIFLSTNRNRHKIKLYRGLTAKRSSIQNDLSYLG